MGRVAGIIAHEINNPLAAITNTLYLVRNHPSLDNTARHFADVAEQELQRVSHITRQTLSFYRESKQPISVNITDLLNDVLNCRKRVLTSSHIALDRKYSVSPVVQGFPVELRQVFLNLVGNAVQAMPSGGRLRVHVRDAADWVRQRRGVSISIVDTGIGIRPEDSKRLFQPFFSTKSTKGTGLGLWISKGIVQKYDGTLTCRSYRTPTGSATCFRRLSSGNRRRRGIQERIRRAERSASRMAGRELSPITHHWTCRAADRIGLRKRQVRHALLRCDIRRGAADIPMLSRRVGPHDQKIITGMQAAVSRTGGKKSHISGAYGQLVARRSPPSMRRAEPATNPSTSCAVEW